MFNLKTIKVSKIMHMSNKFNLGRFVYAQGDPGEQEVETPVEEPVIEKQKINVVINRAKNGTPYIGFRLPASVYYIGKNNLMRSGYKIFKGMFTKPINSLADLETVESDLRSFEFEMDIEFDKTALDSVRSEMSGKKPVVTDSVPVEQTKKEMTPADEKIMEWKIRLKEEVKNTPLSEVSKMIAEKIDKELETLANSVDEAAKQNFIKSFLEFSSKFYNYSFGNQMLIFLQTGGKATHVDTFKRWQEKGRNVRSGEKSIGIFVPFKGRKKEDSPSVDEETGFPVENDTPERERIFFAFKNCLFDVSQTDVDSNFEAKTGKKPFEPLGADVWAESNVENEKAEALVDAALSFAKEKKIIVNLEAETGESEGYSSGGNVSIKKESIGLRRFSTVVHELAHEILHWTESRTMDRTMTRQEREIDAESTSYVVLKYFGFEPTTHANYLALWKAKSENVRQRAKNINKAVKEIIEGIRKYFDQFEKESAGSVLDIIKISSYFRNKKISFNLKQMKRN